MSSQPFGHVRRTAIHSCLDSFHRHLNHKTGLLFDFLLLNCRLLDEKSVKLFKQYRYCGRLLFKHLINRHAACHELNRKSINWTSIGSLSTPALHSSPPTAQQAFTLLFHCDLLFDRVFVHLTYHDLFRVRTVNRNFRRAIDLYFSRQTRIDLSSIDCDFNTFAFDVLLRDQRSLRELNLANCKWLNSSCLLRSIDHVQFTLKVLDLSDCRCLNDRDLHQFFGYDCLRQLHTVKLNNCHWLSRCTLLRLVQNCGSTLIDVQLASCWQLDDSTVAIFSSHSVHLESLVLARVYSITDHSLMTISQNLKLLRYIDVSGCWRITDRGIQCLMKNCAHLRQINAYTCFRVKAVSGCHNVAHHHRYQHHLHQFVFNQV